MLSIGLSSRPYRDPLTLLAASSAPSDDVGSFVGRNNALVATDELNRHDKVSGRSPVAGSRAYSTYSPLFTTATANDFAYIPLSTDLAVVRGTSANGGEENTLLATLPKGN